jgi:hypothetical protein
MSRQYSNMEIRDLRNKTPNITTMFVKKLLLSNLETLSKEDPNFDDINEGIAIIWHDYYKNAKEGKELVSSVEERLNKDLNSNIYIKAYIKAFEKFWK